MTLPDLAKGETYAGILLKDGKPAHHLVLLPGGTTATWKDAIAWAKKQGGELPTRKEQALLFANAADEFEPRWYWSSKEYAGTADYAWVQGFSFGYQCDVHKSYGCRARAVRRVAI
ncbi:MAG: DUF1566 domain-containing protein [Betaproteobacteria bacterium]|nr:MAG: DUF1566 domain-containing protein [Betaproteobacteria bacterium]